MDDKAADIAKRLEAANAELAELDSQRDVLRSRIEALTRQIQELGGSTTGTSGGNPLTTRLSPEKAKIALFRRLFRGREDVYARRFESRKTGKGGYAPACRNEWRRGICQKPRVKCADCEARDFIPVTDEVIRNHLLGRNPTEPAHRDFTIGVYPLLPHDTCWFLAVDFDKATWREDASAFLETCRQHNVPAALERSRSGNGGHTWIFLGEPVQAAFARRMGSYLLTETMERRPEIGLDSYDRFFPSQDTLPEGGFGNLIALPLQRKPREAGNSVFLDYSFKPHPDQWSFLSSIQPLARKRVEDLADVAMRSGRVLGVRLPAADEYGSDPWTAPPSRRSVPIPITGSLPDTCKIVRGNQLYLEKHGFPPALLNRLIRLAAFQNPEFYKAQALRLPTYATPRIISCCEDFPQHIGIPRGCEGDVRELLQSLGIKPDIIDERFSGSPLDVDFVGELRPDQEQAARALLAHDTGVLSATTAFGKTVVALYVLAKRAVNTLILVHRRQLLDQWCARLRAFLGLDKKDIGQIGGGKRNPTGRIDVAIIQSLNKKNTVDDIVGEYGHIIVDECHHISARSFELVARQCKARYVTGLSATVARKDGHHPIIFMQCGPIRYRVDARKQARRRPFTHRVIVRRSGFTYPATGLDGNEVPIHDLYAALVDDNARNEMIQDDVLKALDLGRSPIILSERRSHLEHLAERLEPVVKNLIVLQGGMGQKQRRALAEKIAAIPDGEERLLLATGRYLGEGFDDSRLDTLFLTLPVSWRGTLVQYAGRLHRLHEAKKEVRIYDYADLNVPVLSRMYWKRCRGYRAIGYEMEEAQGNDEVS